MTKKINDGGPAFPNGVCDSNTGSYHIVDGMSLRDYFAAKAMQGMSANPGCNNYNLSKIAELSYKQSDEMLKAKGGKDDTIDKS